MPVAPSKVSYSIVRIYHMISWIGETHLGSRVNILTMSSCQHVASSCDPSSVRATNDSIRPLESRIIVRQNVAQHLPLGFCFWKNLTSFIGSCSFIPICKKVKSTMISLDDMGSIRLSSIVLAVSAMLSDVSLPPQRALYLLGKTFRSVCLYKSRFRIRRRSARDSARSLTDVRLCGLRLVKHLPG